MARYELKRVWWAEEDRWVWEFHVTRPVTRVYGDLVAHFSRGTLLRSLETSLDPEERENAKVLREMMENRESERDEQEADVYTSRREVGADE